MSASSPKYSAKITPSSGAKTLQERLHELLTKLAATIEWIKNWPESEGDDASIHVETTTKLIANIQAVLSSVEKVDGVVKDDAELRKNLQECLIPLDLLDLLDHGSGLNPDCFSRALLKEAMGQLAGLKRRKLALEMLGAAVRQGLNQREAQEAAAAAKTTAKTESIKTAVDMDNAKQEEGLKRKRADEVEEVAADIKAADGAAVAAAAATAADSGGGSQEPPTKKPHIAKDEDAQ